MRTKITYNPVLLKSIPLEVMLKTLPTKGNLVYEYNPFRNYRLTSNKFYYKEKYYSELELEEKCKLVKCYKDNNNKLHRWTGSLKIKTNNNKLLQDKSGTILIAAGSNTATCWGLKIGETKENNVIVEEFEELTVELYEKGQLVDFETDELKFSLNHPVNIVPLYSYDGSVNLIINDGLNIPRLINSRFSATGKNTYEIVDRKGSNDTNIYDLGEQFDIDTSLYKIVNKIPKVNFLGVSSGGSLKIGNYHFYFKLTDTDGNETDFVAESGLVSVFIGHNAYSSVYTGNKNENSTKQVEFRLEDVDSAYDYISVYYSRYTAENGENSVYEYKKILKKYSRTSSKIIITGFEDTEDIAVTDINLHYNLVESAKTQAVCLNMLFLGNVKQLSIPHEELQDLSLRIMPFLGQEAYLSETDPYYFSRDPQNSYINANFIYNKTGYWPNELYRFGIVYILPNGQLTPVFNVRGGIDITTNSTFLDIPIYENDERRFINYNENTSLIVDDTKQIGNDPCYYHISDKNIIEETNDARFCSYENVKGVCRFKPNITTADVNPLIYYVKFAIPQDVKEELGKYVKGYFFVRQSRIPSVLAQGVTIGIDNESKTPTIPTMGGVLQELNDSLEKTHVETEDINGVNYISEGFLKRYSFYFKKKSSGFWGKIGKIAAIAALVAGTVAVGIITGGGAFAAVASVYGTIATVTATTILATAAGVAGAVVGAGVTALTATVQDIGYNVMRIGAKKRLNGRATKAPNGYKIVEEDNSRKLTHSFKDRIIIKDPSHNEAKAIICPDYTVNQAYYNQIFTGNEHRITTDNWQNAFVSSEGDGYFNNKDRHFYIDMYKNVTVKNEVTAKVIGVPDNTKAIGLDNELFRSRAGEAEMAYKYLQVGVEREGEDKKINTDIIRGSFSPYLAINSGAIGPAKIVNIYAPGYVESNLSDYIDIRMNDNSVYLAISDRYNMKDGESSIKNDQSLSGVIWDTYRGDCYICQFTQRINRNFNDPSAPYNDDIVKDTTWKDNYDPDDSAKFANINQGDVNAVLLGMWVTFLLRSSNNLNIRSLDSSNVDETTMTGHPRGYYPVQPMTPDPTYKKPESLIYNKGFAKSLSEKWNLQSPDVPHIKNWFGTRIMYSDIHINDGYKNGFRVFQGTNYRDYTREYGEITKLVPFESSLLCVFEHGIALIPVNERAVAGQGSGGYVYINTSNVLPENPRIISDSFGSLWAESIIKVPKATLTNNGVSNGALNTNYSHYVYGVDTVAKKIWRTDGNSIECISDFKVQEFLNNNITLGERENTPIIGIRNVKTHYNAFKRDVMFTFYDNTYGFEEKVWNLCWNELLLKFITFYSWVPSYMENINNIPFSFDRNTSKWLAKLGISNANSSFSEGINLTNVIIDHDDKYEIPFTYTLKDGSTKTITLRPAVDKDDDFKTNYIGALSLNSNLLPTDAVHHTVHFSLERDIYKNHESFEIKSIKVDSKDLKKLNESESNTDSENKYATVTLHDVNSELEDAEWGITLPMDAKFAGLFVPIYGLYLKPEENKTAKDKITELCSEIYYRNSAGHSYSDDVKNQLEPTEDNIAEIINREYPIFKDLTGKRPTLPRDKLINPDKIVRLLNIKARILISTPTNNASLSDTFYNLLAGYASGTSLVDAALYETTVAVIPKWNMQFLTTDFWKHGQAGIIDITDNIFPTYWYGKQHPFEFEVVVCNDPSMHKIFTNLEIVANKAKPESFHYEIVGECFDFAKDKVNMYYRQEAKKALYQYNGFDITYNRNFLKTIPKRQAKSADLISKYYARVDTINEIEDYYALATCSADKYSYKHLSGAEIVYYPNRQEYRIWQHSPAISLDELSLDNARSIIEANCKYLEDRWKVTLNPILICYKNEKSWEKPPITIYNTPIPNEVIEYVNNNNGDLNIPENIKYRVNDIDGTNWLDDVDVYGTDFGIGQNRKELDLKDKFMKVRIRYSGEELTIINFLSTIYRVSYS